MTDELIDEVLQIHSAFLYLLKRNSYNLNSDFMNPDEKYPSGCCKLTSIILARVLKSRCAIQPQCVTGTDSQKNTHVWLEWEGDIIDFTAKQFSEEYPDCFIVGVGDSPLHESFKVTDSINYNDVRQEHTILTVQKDIEGYLNRHEK